MKYIKLFSTEGEYTSYIEGRDGEVFLPNVSLVQEGDIVHFNPLTSGGGSTGLDPVLLDTPGTAIVYDVANDSLMTIAGSDYNTTDYPHNKYEPVGVIIMPSSHTEDGNARMMSCKLMGVKTAADGSVTYGSYDASNYAEYVGEDFSGGIAWASPDYDTATGATSALLSAKPDFPVSDAVPSISGGTSGMFYYTDMDDSEVIPALMSYNYLPDGNGGGWWANIEGVTFEQVSQMLMPSPYTSNGGINTALRVADTSMANTHGRTATDMVLDFAKTSGHRFDIFAAANAYVTSGTKSGDWYVPSPLELAYFCAKMTSIYSTMNKLNPQFDEFFDILFTMMEMGDYSAPDNDSRYLASWSSSLFSSSDAWDGGLPVTMLGSGVSYDANGSYGFAVAPVCN